MRPGGRADHPAGRRRGHARLGGILPGLRHRQAGHVRGLNTVIASGADHYASSHTLLADAVGALLEAGARDGTLRTDVSREDVLLAMSGIAQYGTSEQAARLIDLLMEALTKGATANTWT